MGFSEVIKHTIIGEGFPDPCFRAELIGDHAVYMQNVISINEFSSEKITLRLRRGGIIIEGKDLYVKKYCEGDLVVCGKIISIQRI